jgi:ubiquinone biosynthesis protein
VEVQETIREGLGNSEEAVSILKNLEQRPLGSGSIGECYRSRLSTGEEVVVKVIPPSKEKKFKDAMERMKKVQRILDLYAEGEVPGAREASRLIGMFLEMVEKEFDLLNEARNGIRMSEDLPEGIRIPEYVSDLASEKVLVQRLVKGVKLDKVKDPELRRGVVEKLRNLFLVKQVFERGVYHSDLQPGNILVDEETGTAYLLDFGQVGELSEGERKNLMEAGAYFVGDDAARCVEALERMAKPGPAFNKSRLVEEIRDLKEGWRLSNDLSQTVNGIFQACHRSDLWIDLVYLQLLKGVATLEATVS